MMNNSNGLGSTSNKKSGAGLPYAPINWPNPGDIWTWRLGTRISRDGFYRDRYIYPPPRLQKKSGTKLFFDSKKSIITYLQEEFPEADIAAFLNSFTWKVPARKAQLTPRPRKVRPQPKSERNGVTSSAKRRSLRIMSATCRAKRSSQKFSPTDSNDVIIIDLCESTTDDSKSANGDTASCHSFEEHQSEMVSDDSDMLIDSEDNPLSEYLPNSSNLASVSYQSAAPREEIAEARKKLLLLLATDNPVLLSSVKLSEVMLLTTLLKTDPSLNANQHDMLKLIDEIPLACKELQENENISMDADRFSEDLETNIAWATTLENEYHDSKGYESLLRTEVDSKTRKIKELQEQVAALTKAGEMASMDADRFNGDLETNIAWATTLENEYDDSKGYDSLIRAELDYNSQKVKKLQEQIAALNQAAEMKKKEVDKLISKQQMVDECLPKVLKEIEMGKDQKAEWELKKQRAEEQKAKILSKFALLKGFSL